MDDETTSENAHVSAAVMQHISTYLRRRRSIHLDDVEGAQSLQALEIDGQRYVATNQLK